MNTNDDSLRIVEQQIRSRVIEECARVAEDFEKEGRIAAAIRALKDKP